MTGHLLRLLAYIVAPLYCFLPMMTRSKSPPAPDSQYIYDIIYQNNESTTYIGGIIKRFMYKRLIFLPIMFSCMIPASAQAAEPTPSSRISFCTFYVSEMPSATAAGMVAQQTLDLMLKVMAANDVNQVIVTQLHSKKTPQIQLAQFALYLKSKKPYIQYFEPDIADGRQDDPGIFINICFGHPEKMKDALGDRARIKSADFIIGKHRFTVGIQYLSPEFRLDPPMRAVNTDRLTIKFIQNNKILSNEPASCSFIANKNCRPVFISQPTNPSLKYLLGSMGINWELYQYHSLPGITVGFPYDISETRGIVLSLTTSEYFIVGACVSDNPLNVRAWTDTLIGTETDKHSICTFATEIKNGLLTLTSEVPLSDLTAQHNTAALISTRVESIISSASNNDSKDNSQ